MDTLTKCDVKRRRSVTWLTKQTGDSFCASVKIHLKLWATVIIIITTLSLSVLMGRLIFRCSLLYICVAVEWWGLYSTLYKSQFVPFAFKHMNECERSVLVSTPPIRISWCQATCSLVLRPVWFGLVDSITWIPAHDCWMRTAGVVPPHSHHCLWGLKRGGGWSSWFTLSLSLTHTRPHF